MNAIQERDEVISTLRELARRLVDDSEIDAIPVLRAIVLLSEDCVDAHRELAGCYYRAENWGRAILHFKKCCELDQKDYGSLFYLANSYKSLGFYSEAIENYLKSISIYEYPEGLINLSSAYAAAGEHELELHVLNLLTHKFPFFTLGHYNLGVYWYGKKDLAKSIACYRRSLDSDPSHGMSKVALALALLMNKQYIEGFEMYESRWGVIPNCPIRQFGGMYWHGQKVPETSTILIAVEQGFGDMFQMVRFIPALLVKFSKVYLEVQPQMQRILSSAYPQVEVILNGTELPQSDYYCPVMSLPRAFGISYQTIPLQDNYLSVQADGEVNTLLCRELRKKIGVCWRGGVVNPSMVHRSLDLKSIKSLFELDEYVWVSLVKDLPFDEIEELAMCNKVHDFTAGLVDFYDTYQLISSLDMVVTVDTAVAHLAGAMGKPTIVILNEGFDWRWHVDDDVSAWYPNSHLLRTYKLDNESDLVPELAKKIKQLIG